MADSNSAKVMDFSCLVYVVSCVGSGLCYELIIRLEEFCFVYVSSRVAPRNLYNELAYALFVL